MLHLYLPAKPRVCVLRLRLPRSSGQASDPLVVPPAYHVAPPFGTNIGPTNPLFFAISPDCEFDSFLTIGMVGPALDPGALSTIGLDFDSWTETVGVDCTDGAVFFMDPDHGADVEPVTFLQLTVATGTSFSGSLSAQGRSTAGADDWEENSMQYSSSEVGTPTSAGGKEGSIGH